ncbi:hypothetical protein [Lewinella sp. LCG006]|uniref:hypothetical protein n=1 Tax=Lewinella sp. LCG006 TaxID=3231911 RepID=UPI00345FB24C
MDKYPYLAIVNFALENCNRKTGVNWFDIDEQRWSQNQFHLSAGGYVFRLRSVPERSFSQAPIVLQCAAWPPGYYFVQVQDRRGRQWVSKLVVR